MPAARAFPPAPHHTIYGMVRDQYGRPLNSHEGTVILSGSSAEIVRSPTDSTIAVGANYSLPVPMDSGTLSQLYTVSALRPLLPFTIKVVIGEVNYVPIEIAAKTWAIGNPAGATRLDLTLGIDSNNDGLPDAWQQAIVDADQSGKLKSIDDVKPDGDLTGSGLTNLQKFLAGVNALDKLDGVKLEVVDVSPAGIVKLRFLGVTGRSYTIRSSQDSKTWSNQQFSLLQSVAEPVQVYRADSVQFVDVYVNWRPGTRGFFQLFAQ